eukprot:gene1565-948_t
MCHKGNKNKQKEMDADACLCMSLAVKAAGELLRKHRGDHQYTYTDRLWHYRCFPSEIKQTKLTNPQRPMEKYVYRTRGKRSDIDVVNSVRSGVRHRLMGGLLSGGTPQHRTIGVQVRSGKLLPLRSVICVE